MGVIKSAFKTVTNRVKLAVAANRQADVFRENNSTFTNIITKPANILVDAANILTGNAVRGGMNVFSRYYNMKDARAVTKSGNATIDGYYQAMMQSNKGQKQIIKKMSNLGRLLNNGSTFGMQLNNSGGLDADDAEYE